MIILFILSFILAFVLFWLYFISKETVIFQSLGRVGFFVFISITFISGYFLIRQQQTVSALSDLIVPVPEIKELIQNPDELPMAPFFSSSKSSTGSQGSATKKRLISRWIIKTSLPKSRCYEFYLGENNRSGWLVIKKMDQRGFIFEKENLQLTIFLAGEGQGTAVYYLLKKGFSYIDEIRF